MAIDVNVINPFLMATKQVLNVSAGIELSIGKPYIRNLDFTEEYVRIILWLTGGMSAQVIISMKSEIAKEVASKMMMGMPVSELDEMAISAISELGNMTMGNASTIMAGNGIITDITPPVIERGWVHMDIKDFENICVPFTNDGQTYLELNIVVKRK